MREILASEWVAAALGAIVISLHCWWFINSSHQDDVLTGLGGSFAALGIFVATPPYIRKGLNGTAREQVGLHESEERDHHLQHHEDEIEQEGVRHVIKERVVGVALIAVGSMLNGYGVAIARLLSLRGS